MARSPKMQIQLKVWMLGRQFLARPCDDGSRPEGSWCVEEIEMTPKMMIRWNSTHYTPELLMRGKKTIPNTMTKAQAMLEASLMAKSYDAKYVAQQKAARG